MKALVVLILLLLTSSPLAAAPAESPWGMWEAVGRWLNLLILLSVLVYLLKQPIKQFFASRRQGIQHEIQEAGRIREQAEQKFAEIRTRMDNLERELEEIGRHLQHQAELEQQRILENADLESAKILSVAEREIEVLTRAARAELKAYVAQLAIQFAERQLREKMGPAAQAAMVERFVIELGGREGKS